VRVFSLYFLYQRIRFRLSCVACRVSSLEHCHRRMALLSVASRPRPTAGNYADPGGIFEYCNLCYSSQQVQTTPKHIPGLQQHCMCRTGMRKLNPVGLQFGPLVLCYRIATVASSSSSAACWLWHGEAVALPCYAIMAIPVAR
jgi:hypothetical protein